MISIEAASLEALGVGPQVVESRSDRPSLPRNLRLPERRGEEESSLIVPYPTPSRRTISAGLHSLIDLFPARHFVYSLPAIHLNRFSHLDERVFYLREP